MQKGWSFKFFGGRQEKSSSVPAMSKTEAKRRLSTALNLMADRPDGIADISSCSISAIPRDFFHLCGTYVKTSIVLADNLIKDLESGGEIGSLRRIQTIDCHENLMEKLPLNFGDFFPSLVYLNLSDNRLSSLPASFTSLKSLKVLLIARNKFELFPCTINQSKHLEELDVSSNNITALPLELCRLTELKVLTLDSGKMVYPSKDICGQGTAAVLEKLRKDMVETTTDDSGCFSGGEVDSTPNPAAKVVPDTLRRYLSEDERMKDAIKRYNADEGIQRTEMLRFHAAMDEDHLRHAASIYRGKKSEQQSLIRMMEEQQTHESYLQTLTANVEKGKKDLAEALHEMELHSQRLLAQLTSLSEDRAKQFRAYEKDVRKDDLAWANLHTQLEESKRQAILSAMKCQLEDTAKSDTFYKHLMSLAKMQNDNVVNMHRDEEKRYAPMVNKAKMEQDNIINSMLMNERVQQEMFRSLQLKTDSVHLRIMHDLVLLENELSALSLLEQKQRDERTMTAKSCLEDERMKLAKLYQKLLQERQKRETELLAVLRDMEREAVKHEENYWLAAYNRLMETLPQSLLLTTVPSKTERKIVEKHFVQTPSPVAPRAAATTAEMPWVPSVLHMETVCIICLDRQSTSIFLPCGHICCCTVCGDKVEECPLCRTTIARKLTLSQSVDDAGSGDAKA